MHTILFNESFSFCSRDQLERLQPVSQSLLDIIVAGSNVLPLRPIDRIHMDFREAAGKIQIYVEVDADDIQVDYEASVHDGDFAEIVLRLRNTCIKEFMVGIRDSPFLRYWKTQETAFTVVSVKLELPETTDYDLLDSIVNHLRPRTTEEVQVWPDSWYENGYKSERVKLLARDSFRNNVHTCRFNAFGSAFPALEFFLKDPGYPNYELECNRGQVADGIDRFIESFVRDGCANEKLESVCIKWREWGSKPSLMPQQLGKSTKIDMPLPKNDLSSCITRYDPEVTQCETQSFVNKKQWKQMEVYLWTVEFYPGRCCCIIYLLQCLVKNL
ncbi:hypothetical protein AAVH_25144 [Aphelenchoides avenae]|nr:hypothetical protein AAVH_25144 [Aphelenchus avenae]